MIIYIDETECDNFFLVAGLLTPSKEATDFIYKKFKKRIKNMPLSAREKEKVFTEFKSILLDREYQKIKIHMLECINQLNYQIYYSVYDKKDIKMNQQLKEEVYINLLNNIITSINFNIEVIFDTFNKKDFEKNIIETIGQNKNVVSITPRDSRLESGLQFIDNICSALRLYRTKSNNDFYKFIHAKTIEV